MSEPVTRKEQLLSAIATGGDVISPVTREEMYLAYMAGDTSVVLPEPVTRKEQFLYKACLNGGSGGGGITPSGTKNITKNGVYDVTAYASANVNVPTEEINNQDKTITENGEYTADAGFTGLGTVTVNVPTSGGGAAPSAKWNNVTFIDYDGSVLYSYSLEEAKALTELPALPTHDGLVCQGWNWALDAIKVLNRPVTVGAMYITDDGATRLHIRIATIGRMTVTLYIGQTVANGVSIDWGDGSTAETLSGTGNVNTSHTYADPGDYVISLMPEDGCKLSFGSNSSSYCVMGSTGNNGKVYCNMLQDVQVGTGVTSIGDYAFLVCNSLASVTIPDSVTSIGNYSFYGCYGVAEYHLKPTTPPTLYSTNAFNNISSDCIIYVPQGCLEAYQSATNWATYADYMQEEPT